MGPELLFLAVWVLCGVVGAIYVGILCFDRCWLKGAVATVGLVGGFLPLFVMKGPAGLSAMSYLAMFGSGFILLAGFLQRDRAGIILGSFLVAAFAYHASVGRWIRYDSAILFQLPGLLAEFAMILAPIILMFGLAGLASGKQNVEQ